MASDRIEWVEIIEPKTKEHMYANLATGECVWDPPEGVTVKRTDSSQWWELFDIHTSRFYYYNAALQSTVWHRPTNCDIIPLAKLQTLKQNTDPGDSKEGSTPVITAPQVLQKEHKEYQRNGQTSDNGSCKVARAVSTPVTSETQTSPVARRQHRSVQERPTTESSSRRGGGCDSHRHCRHAHSHTHRHTDSGRSSDSSLSSAQGYRRLQESGSLRAPAGSLSHSHSHRKHSSDSGYRMLQESSSSSNIPAFKYDPPASPGPPHSASTPQLKKKYQSSHSPHATPSGLQTYRERANTSIVGKQRSFDTYSGPVPAPLARSGSFMASRKDNSDDSMHEKYFKSVENTPVSRRRNKLGNHSSSDSSPHSPESTYRDTTHPELLQPSVKSSEQFNHLSKPNRPSLVSSISLATDVCSSNKANLGSLDRPNYSVDNYNIERHNYDKYNFDRNSEKNDLRYFHDKMNLDLNKIEKQNRHIDKFNLESERCDKNIDRTGRILDQPNKHILATIDREKPNRQLSSIEFPKYHPAISKTEMDQYQAARKKISQCSLADEHCTDTNYQNISEGYLAKPNLEPYLSKPNLEKHNLEYAKNDGKKSLDKVVQLQKLTKPNLASLDRDQVQHKHMSSLERDNGNTSPLYSNWDLEMQEHLLPLKHYILEQAKLSGCYRMGDPLDSDSLHSDSQSERSLSGHEPDNEDSDHSGSNDDYLTHHYGSAQEYGTHGVSYYNTSIPLPLSSVGVPAAVKQDTRCLPTIADMTDAPIPEQAIYSPVRSHAKPSILVQQNVVKECDIEQFAQDNLNLHAKGIFRKKSSVRDMLSWTSSAISRPMLALARDKVGKKSAIEMFKLVQIYMADRKARPGMTLNSVAMDIIGTAFSNQALRDELYVQLCRQTTENPQRDSLLRGWELLAISLSFIPPSPTFQPALLGYMNRHRDPAFATSFPEVGKWPIHVQVSHYATVACNRLDRIGCTGKKQARKPSGDEIDQARIQIFNPSMFGNTLGEVMLLQKDRFPYRQLPWVQVALSEQVLRLNGRQTEGIFRVSADVDEVNMLKTKLDKWELPELNSTMDAHAPASLLKLWYRELYEPLIPDILYNECVSTEVPQRASDIVNRLPHLNRLVLTYLVNFLQQFSRPEIVANTKMDSANLAMVFAPNCLRCTSTDPRVILENARKEMTFIRMLIQHLDTSCVKDIT